VSRHQTARILHLEENLFRPYGRILEPAAGERPEASEPGSFEFFVPFREARGGGAGGDRLAPGWQIGYLVCTCRTLHRLERHPNTPEVFCPLEGEALLVVAMGGITHGGLDPNEGRSALEPKPVGFPLDRPIVFNRGVWHGVISLTDKSTILIAENADVVDEFLDLALPLAAPGGMEAE
jgi:ureidoglycolate hydrolase